MRLRRTDERGFALLLVLWTTALLALIFTQLVSSGRSETAIAANVRAGASAEAAADAALYQAIFHLLDPSRAGWAADGRTYDLHLPGARASVSIIDLSGRVNPNTASVALLAALMAELGTERTRAEAVAQAIVDWRSPGDQGAYTAPRYAAAGLPYRPAQSAFQSIDELGLVLGMTPDLLQRLAPHLSLANPDNPDRAHADPVVLRAMRDIGLDMQQPAKQARARDVLITAAATDSAGARFVRRAIVRLGSTALFEILGWSSPSWS